MTKIITIMLALSLTAALSARAADGSLDAAINLYMSAAYEDALAELSRLSPGVDVDQADKYRALCLLGLNRPQEAAEAIDRLVTRRPLLKVDETDSPKLVAMYRDAQARVIPGAAKALYATARNNFEHGEVATSAAEFRRVLDMIAAINPGTDGPMADLKMLAEGFGKLADQQVASAREPGSAAKPSGDGASERRSPTAAAPAAPQIFDATDADVAPPIPLAQVVPPWSPRVDGEKRKYTGTIEVIIDESGMVSAATLTTPVYPAYDQQLLQATKNWRYRPARRGGQPVKYRKAIAVVLAPPAS